MEPKIDKENGVAASKKGYNQIVITIRDGKVISFEQSFHDSANDGTNSERV
ncbi:hypothetical protein [Anaerospora hongkongensis]|uniref:hypothetical protein n=1 Tax=Anaerospora hongkongensis TaxID=244830 RepID=UPI002FDAE2A5